MVRGYYHECTGGDTEYTIDSPICISMQRDEKKARHIPQNQHHPTPRYAKELAPHTLIESETAFMPPSRCSSGEFPLPLSS